METPRYIAELAAKRLADTLTVAESNVLEQWADSNPEYRAWLDDLSWARLMEMLDAQAPYQPVENVWDNSALWQHIQKSLPRRGVPIYRRVAARWLAGVAALLLVAVGLFLWNRGAEHEGQQQAAAIAADITPGGNRATLTLADGQTVDLNETQQGIVVGHEDITYRNGASLGLPPSETFVLTTPNGGTYQVTLPDGSRVWLNAASTLKYPSRFDDDERVVELIGEGYFEVKSVKTANSASGRYTGSTLQPFKVITNGQAVEVLGTAFNISAYADEAQTKTTLVEGSVRLSPTRLLGGTSGLPDNALMLVPGEQGTLAEGTLTKRQVDITLYTAWRDGRFSFTGKAFTQVMAEFARWYDVEVRYEGAVPNDQLVGGAYRTDDFGAVLRLLESGGIPYRVDGRTLIINPKREGEQ